MDTLNYRVYDEPNFYNRCLNKIFVPDNIAGVQPVKGNSCKCADATGDHPITVDPGYKHIVPQYTKRSQENTKSKNIVEYPTPEHKKKLGSHYPQTGCHGDPDDGRQIIICEADDIEWHCLCEKKAVLTRRLPKLKPRVTGRKAEDKVTNNDKEIVKKHDLKPKSGKNQKAKPEDSENPTYPVDEVQKDDEDNFQDSEIHYPKIPKTNPWFQFSVKVTGKKLPGTRKVKKRPCSCVSMISTSSGSSQSVRVLEDTFVSKQKWPQTKLFIK